MFILGEATVDHYENFPVASFLLPRELRRPVALIYRFAREADDFADEGHASDAERLAQLEAFRAELRRIESGAPPGIAWFAALGEAIRSHRLPIGLFFDLLAAFSLDVTKKRYANFGEVLAYCRGSANPVGRLLLVLFGGATDRNNRYSDAVCSALQLVNFLQDIAIDYGKGRIYLPQDELARFGVTESHIAAGDTGGRWREFMAFQIARARNLLYAGLPLGRALKGRVGLEMRMIIAGGDHILTRIAEARGDVYRRRPMLRRRDWLLMTARALAARRA